MLYISHGGTYASAIDIPGRSPQEPRPGFLSREPGRAGGGDLLELVGAALLVEPGEPAGERRQRVGIGATHGDVLEQRSQAMSFWRSRGCVSARSVSVTPTQSTIKKWVLAVASGVTARSSVGSMMRTPRPFICSNSTRLLTDRMNITISIGRISVPVAIRSTVTTTRG
jgi:hypothetical protein